MKKIIVGVACGSLLIGYLFFSILSNDLKKEVAKQEAEISSLRKEANEEKEKNNEVLVELNKEKNNQETKQIEQVDADPIDTKKSYDSEVKSFLDAMYNYDNKTNRQENLSGLVTDSFNSYLDSISGVSDLEYHSTLKKYDIYKNDTDNNIVVVRVTYTFKVASGELTTYEVLLTLQFVEDSGVLKVDKQGIESIQSQNQMKNW
nr:hypothetical protein [Carnobacterium maltaromaticum]